MLSVMIDLAVYLVIIITTTLVFSQIHNKLSILGLLVGVMVVIMITGVEALQLVILTAIASIAIVLVSSRLKPGAEGAED